MAFVKAREIEEKLKGKVDPVLLNFLGALAERDKVQHDQIVQIAQAYDRLVDMFSDVLKAIGGISDAQKKTALRLGLDTNLTDNVKSFNETDDDTGKTH